MSVPYRAAEPTGVPTGRLSYAPFIFCANAERWGRILGPDIDEVTSDPKTLDVLCHLLCYTQPQVLVEVGTYRGWGTACFAETLRTYCLPGHLWSCDPVDHGVATMLADAELTDRVTLITGTFEDLLAQLKPPMDFCYIDASAPGDAGLRSRYVKLALEHMNQNGIIAVDDANGGWPGAKTLRKKADLYLPQHRGLVLLTT